MSKKKGMYSGSKNKLSRKNSVYGEPPTHRKLEYLGWTGLGEVKFVQKRDGSHELSLRRGKCKSHGWSEIREFNNRRSPNAMVKHFYNYSKAFGQWHQSFYYPSYGKNFWTNDDTIG